MVREQRQLRSLMRKLNANGLFSSMRQILAHGIFTVLAVAFAFSLPSIARYILYQWWPRMESDANLLLATEVLFASAILLVFNWVRIALENRRLLQVAMMAGLVHARKPVLPAPGDDAPRKADDRRREQRLIERVGMARDAFILSPTGHDTFIDPASVFRPALEIAYEIRVMLLNPYGEGIRQRVNAMPDQITLLSFHGEIEASVAYLTELRKRGKKVHLKFYNPEPFWKVVVLGDHAWVQHCHSGLEVRQQSEYVFALQPHDPRSGFFVPFYAYVLNQWNSRSHADFDFDTQELVYRDNNGNGVRRAPLRLPAQGMQATGISQPVPALAT